MRNLILEHKRSPGDILVLSALIRDIMLTYPNQFRIALDTTVKEIWNHNPYVTPLSELPAVDVEHLRLSYGGALGLVGTTNKHFLLGFHDHFQELTGIRVPLLYPRPDYHLSADEIANPIVKGKYWVVVAGGKSDFITKHWSYKRWQQVVNILHTYGLNFVQVGGLGTTQDGVAHIHPVLENVTCLVGRTTIRDLASLIYHAEGVLCPVTAAMHFAAALQKPCVVVAGGREEWWWEAYTPYVGNFGNDLREEVKVPHRFLHTIGKLDCCKHRGCWRSNLTGEASVCRYPLPITGQLVPKCMDMITVDMMINAVLSYYEDGTLSGLKTPQKASEISSMAEALCF